VTGLSEVRGTCLLWHDREQLGAVEYELSLSCSADEPVTITGRLIGLPEDLALSLFGQRLTMRFEGGEEADCFLADATGRIALTVNGLHSIAERRKD
jgi:hypothetical protein